MRELRHADRYSSAPISRYCVDTSGKLQQLHQDRFENMVQWALRRDGNLTREGAEEKTRAYMRTMPAWKDHPRIKTGAPESGAA